MKKMNSDTQKTVIRIVLALFSFALFVNSLYAFYYEYLRWTSMSLVGFYTILMAASGGITGLLLAKSTGKTQKTGRTVLFTVLFALLPIILLWGITYYVNTVLHDGTQNELAMRIAASVVLVEFAVVLMLVFIFVFKGKLKILVRLTGAALAVALFACSFVTSLPIMEWNCLYPVYRVFTPQGGAATIDKNIYYEFARSTRKIQPVDNLGSNSSIDIALAGNEREGFQLFICSDKEDKKITVDVTDFKNAAGNSMPTKVYAEVFTSVKGYGSIFSSKFADALVPYAGEIMELEKNMIRAFYIETVSTVDTVSGEYIATVTITDGEKTIQTSSVSAHVWDFELPAAPSTDTAMGIASSGFWKLNELDASSYGWNGNPDVTLEAAQAELYKQYYDYLLAHGISAYNLPYDILDDRADAYMSDPRVTSFMIPYASDDAQLVKYYTKVNSNPEWAAKGYFYPIDEPRTTENVAKYTEITDRLVRLCPGYNMVTPFFSLDILDNETGDTIKNFEMQCGRSNILCPESVCYDENKGFYELMQERVALGDKSWWYVCCGPTGDYCNMFIRLDAIKQRLLFWQEKSLDVTGLLYWNTVYYDKANPWVDSRTWGSYETGGDGCLIYPGRYIDVDEPIGTIRLKNVADGIEDYTYLTLAENKFGEQWVDEKISRIVSSLTDYTSDYELFEQVRRVIGDELAK